MPSRFTGGLFTYANNTTYFNRTDHLGTPRLTTDYTGAVQRTEGVLMGPFGDGFSETASPFVDFTGFAGGVWDAENNADHFGAREYAKTQGRWMSPDPAGLAAVDPTNPQSWNRYAYVTNNPTGFVDPSGLNEDASGCHMNPDPAVNELVCGGGGGVVIVVIPIGGGPNGPPNAGGPNGPPNIPPGLTGRGGPANNGTPTIGPDNGKSKPNVPPEWGFCGKYRDGSGGGSALYQICMNTPNSPWGNCVRGTLLNQYTPNPNPPELFVYLFVDHPVDFASCLGK